MIIKFADKYTGSPLQCDSVFEDGNIFVAVSFAAGDLAFGRLDAQIEQILPNR